MKTINSTLLITIIALLCSVGTTEVKAQASTDNGQVALGVVVGDPTGISFKYWMGSKNAVDAGVAWSFQGVDAIGVHTDYLWHSWLDVDKGRLALYYGVGAKLWVGDATGLGVRIPVGLNYLFADAPLDLFVEIVPALSLIPDTDFNGNGGLGVRFYF